MKTLTQKLSLAFGLFIALAMIGFGLRAVLAQPELAPIEQASVLHPTFALLDVDGKNVLNTDKAVSTMQTCGECHDTQFIQSHAFHSDLGLSDYKETSDLNSSSGLFGNWDPITYRYLSQAGDERLDLSTAEWRCPTLGLDSIWHAGNELLPVSL
jgi:hypothetical protein